MLIFHFEAMSHAFRALRNRATEVLRIQGVVLRVTLEEVDPDVAPWLIIPSSPEASAVLPALTSWDVEPSATDMQITLESHMVTLATPAGNATASCKLQVRSLRQCKQVSSNWRV